MIIFGTLVCTYSDGINYIAPRGQSSCPSTLLQDPAPPSNLNLVPIINQHLNDLLSTSYESEYTAINNLCELVVRDYSAIPFVGTNAEKIIYVQQSIDRIDEFSKANNMNMCTPSKSVLDAISQTNSTSTNSINSSPSISKILISNPIPTSNNQYPITKNTSTESTIPTTSTKTSNPVSTAINVIKSKTTSIPNALINFYSMYRNYLLGLIILAIFIVIIAKGDKKHE